MTHLQDYIFITKYARWDEEKGRRETYEEACHRVLDMHHRKYDEFGLKDVIDEAGRYMLDQKILGSQRALQFGGTAIEKKNARLYNCIASHCNRPRFFQEALWLLLCGCGVGFSVQKHHVEKLPRIKAPILFGDQEPYTHIIADTIEGWADAAGALVKSYFIDKGSPYGRHPVKFDYSRIRPKGALIKSCSGKAPGPEPLRRSLDKVREVLDQAVANKQDRLRPIDCYDIIMHISDAVLSGGIRRSATICIFSSDDEEMITAKTGNWLEENPQRARSNNSALLLRDKTSFQDFQKFTKYIQEYGEPGFVWADNTEIIFNPCCEIGLYPVDEKTGQTGWQACNLTEINMKKVRSEEDFKNATWAAAVIGTLQAGYTDFGYLGEVSERIIRREALLGVSMTGMMDSPEIAFDGDLQVKMAQYVLEVNEKIAGRIGINRAARATCIKPSGTAATLLGTSSGIHPHHSKKYFRRVQSNRVDPPTQFYEMQNPRSVEDSVWNPNGTDVVITFCVEADEKAHTKKSVSALELLTRVRGTKRNWVDSGTRIFDCVEPWLSHNVSNTIHVKPAEWDEVIGYIYQHRSDFAGVSLLSEAGELEYPQAPFVSIMDEHEIVDRYGVGAIMASGLIVDGFHAFDDLWQACAVVLGSAKEPITRKEIEWEELSDPFWDEAVKNIGTRLKESTNEEEKEVLRERLLDAQQKRITHMQEVVEELEYFNNKVIGTRLDWVRRAEQFAERYFNNDLRQMTFCLKRVHNCKLWYDIKRELYPVFYEEMEEGEDKTNIADTVACGGGQCDIINTGV